MSKERTSMREGCASDKRAAFGAIALVRETIPYEGSRAVTIHGTCRCSLSAVSKPSRRLICEIRVETTESEPSNVSQKTRAGHCYSPSSFVTKAMLRKARPMPAAMKQPLVTTVPRACSCATSSAASRARARMPSQLMLDLKSFDMQ